MEQPITGAPQQRLSLPQADSSPGLLHRFRSAVFGPENKGLSDTVAPPEPVLLSASASPAHAARFSSDVSADRQKSLECAGANTSGLVTNNRAPSFFGQLKDVAKASLIAAKNKIQVEYAQPGFWKKLAVGILGAVLGYLLGTLAVGFAAAKVTYDALDSKKDHSRIVAGVLNGAQVILTVVAFFVGASAGATINGLSLTLGNAASGTAGFHIGWQTMAAHIQDQQDKQRRPFAV